MMLDKKFSYCIAHFDDSLFRYITGENMHKLQVASPYCLCAARMEFYKTKQTNKAQHNNTATQHNTTKQVPTLYLFWLFQVNISWLKDTRIQYTHLTKEERDTPFLFFYFLVRKISQDRPKLAIAMRETVCSVCSQ